jgi:hypothetical protein
VVEQHIDCGANTFKMSSTGSVMSRIRMFEASGGEADASVDQTRKIHPFNRPAGNTYQDARSRASPSNSSLISSNEWQDFSSESPRKIVDQGTERRTDSDDTTGRGEPEARIGFTSVVNPPTRSLHENHTTDQSSTEPEQRPAEVWDQSSTEPWNDKGSIDELDWPPTKAVQNPMVLNSGDESQEPPVEPQSSPFHPSSWNQTSRSARLQTIRPRAPSSLSGSSLSGSNPELKRNLDAASVVMQEERESSIGSKSSSSRSSLSNEELGTVAKRAWKLSKIQSQTRASRLQNSPLHQMLKEKRSRKYVVEKPSETIPTDKVEEIEEIPSESSRAAQINPKSSDISSSNSELRLSARLFRAEKYASVVRHNREPRLSVDSVDDTSIDNSQQLESSKGNVHPVFGYTANQTTATREKHVDDDGTLSENSDSASGSRSASNDLVTTSSKAEDAANANLSASSRGKTSRSERARQLKAVISKTKGKQSSKLTTTATVRDESSYESAEVQTSGRGNEGHLDQYNDNTALMDNALDDFESDFDFDRVRNPNPDQPLYHSTLNSVSDVDNSVLDGEGIAQISSGDESALNWSVTTGSVSATTPFAHLNTSSNEGSARISSKASSGGSVSQRLAPIPDDDPREHSLFSYTESLTSSGKEFQADKSTTDTSSSTMKPDALRWWQKKYGKKMSGSSNSVVRNAFSRLSPKSIPQDRGFFKIEDDKDENDEGEDDEGDEEGEFEEEDEDDEDDEDDVFFGLEDDDRFPTEEPLGFDGEAQEPFSSEEDGDIGIPAPTYENRDMGGDENESKGEAARTSPPPPQASHSVQAPLEPSKKQGVYGHSGMMVSEANAGRSVTSDMTSSIIKAKKSPRYRQDVVETIREESVEEVQNGFVVDSIEEDEDGSIEGEEMDETTVGSATNTNVGSTIYSQPPPPPPPPPPPGHILLNIGCAIVDTLSNACRIPGKSSNRKSYSVCIIQNLNSPTTRCPDPADVPEPVAQCATKTRDTCKIKSDDFGKNYASVCDTKKYDEFTNNNSKYDSASGKSGPAPSTTLTEDERRIWSEWDNRDQQSAMQGPSSHHSGLTDLLTQDTPQGTEVQRYRREEARKKLLQYAGKAMALLSSKKDDKAPHEAQSPIEVNQDLAVDTSVEDQRPDKLLAPVASPTDPGMFSPLSYKERSVLEKFSSTLRNEGIEVLKLNRRNKWQIRFLSVSREVTWLNTEAENADIGQCPKALLWLKRFQGSSYGISNLKNQGRGGILFTKLQSVETTSNPSSEKEKSSRVMSVTLWSRATASKTSSSHIPKRLKAMFDENACVSLEYLFEGGTRTVTLCFKNTRDAKTFCAAMKIIKDVVEREQESTLSAMQIVESVVDRNK